MATLVLGAVGSAVGGVLGGPLGATLGKALGSFAGNALDHHLFGASSHREGPRLKNLDVQASTEGAGLPLTFGRVRLSGQVIWATRFEEVATTTRNATGGKGGGPQATSTSYAYFGNFAIGLAQGPIASIARVWADGKLLDLNTVSMRVYRGTPDQQADPLIEAKEGSAPAFRDTAYVVFERLALEPYGNRLPQLAFEVIRPFGGLEEKLRAITIIPGATEFGYDPLPVTRVDGPGTTAPENTHDATAPSDWAASLDQLQALCPNLERVALVVAWFGTSLDAASCLIEPRVERADKTTSKPWSVAGLTRSNASLVSLHAGKPAYGSSPSDASVIAAIKDLKARGLKVTLLPFIMMDVPADNALPDPWTGSPSQPAYPWRGMITLSPAPGRAGSPDASQAAASAVASFCGDATAAHFSVVGEAVNYAGPAEWRFNRFILHMAALAKAAGGVDAFLLSSELLGLTSVRSARAAYPFVDQLVSLAGQVRALLGPDTILTYGADWSEYSNHRPNDGSGDLTFHLDKLWASANIDVIGIDQYQPITDWRYASTHADQALGEGPSDPRVIRAGLAGGENHDWYYASEADRQAQIRTAITDIAYGEPWVFRSKDFVSWWTNVHYNRVGGVRQATPTAFIPRSKPFWLTEFGAPAVDLAGNRPSAFPSDKPDNHALPPFSRGYRDDACQRSILETALDWWGQVGTPANPLSAPGGHPMIDPSAIHLWTWDARPFPAFPYAGDVWSDGVNWVRGHWLNGRLGGVSLASLLRGLGEHFDLPPIDTGGVEGVVEGYSLGQPTAARGVFVDLCDLYAIDLRPSAQACVASMRSLPQTLAIEAGSLAQHSGAPLISILRAGQEDLPRQTTLGFVSSQHDYRPGIVRSMRQQDAKGADRFKSVPLTMDPAFASSMVERMMQEMRVRAQSVELSLPPSQRGLEPGDGIDLSLGEGAPRLKLRIARVVDGAQRRVEAHALDLSIYQPSASAPTLGTPAIRSVFGPPDLVVLDLPAAAGRAGDPHNVKLAAFGKPWPGTVDVYAGSTQSAFTFVQALAAPASMGSLVSTLAPGPIAMAHTGGQALIDIPTGALSSVTRQAMLAGANLAALVDGQGLEVIAFQNAQLVEPGRYTIHGLLRGLAGTEDRARRTTPAGARFVLLDGQVEALAMAVEPLRLGTTLRAQPHRAGVSSDARTDIAIVAQPLSLVPLAPVHLRAKALPGGDVGLSWVRRARGASDDWELAGVPLNEESEAYQIDISLGGTLTRTARSDVPGWTYTAEAQAEDAALAGFSFAVRQIGTAGRLGHAASGLFVGAS